MLRRTSIGVVLSLVVLVPNPVRADIVEWKPSDGGNGHYYELLMPDSQQDSYSWTNARVAASSMTYDGMQGYLATVTSAGESDFLRENFSSQLVDLHGPNDHSKYAWIGLFAPTPFSGFQWVTGESLNYTNWAPGEPNYYGTPLWQYVHYWTRDFGSGPTWTWNNEQDLPGRNIYGFFVEFGGGQDLGAGPSVPEPSTLVIAGVSGALFLVHSLCRRRV